MKNIQFLSDNNTTVRQHTVKGCVKECTDYCKGEELVISSIPVGVIPTSITTIIVNPLGETVDVDVEVGIAQIGHNIETFHYDTKLKNKVYVNDITPKTTVANENVLVRLNEELPKGSEVCVLITYLAPEVTEADSIEVEPNLCACVEDCEVYKEQ